MQTSEVFKEIKIQGLATLLGHVNNKCVEAARRREELNECLTTVKQVFFIYQEGHLVDRRAYKPYSLVGPPALRLVIDPLAVIFLGNRLYVCTTLTRYSM